jgi:hypothetical protein
MFGYGIAAGLIAGLAIGVFLGWWLVRSGMALHERLERGFKEDEPVFGNHEGSPLEFAATGDTKEDLEVDDDQ